MSLRFCPGVLAPVAEAQSGAVIVGVLEILRDHGGLEEWPAQRVGLNLLRVMDRQEICG